MTPNAIHFFPAPDSPAAVISIRLYQRPGSLPGRAWAALREALAVDMDCYAVDFESEEVILGAESVEIVRLNGEIIGSLDRELTGREIAAIEGAPMLMAAE